VGDGGVSEGQGKRHYDGVDTYMEGIGTVRECIDCAALIAGGPTRCIRCVKEGAPRLPLLKRLYLVLAVRRIRLRLLSKKGRKIREERERGQERRGSA
jgi:hypothetical protein